MIIDAGPCTLELRDPRTFSEAEIAEGVELHNVLHAEEMPEDDPFLLSVAISSNRAIPARLGRWSVRARAKDGQLLATTAVSQDWEHNDNPDVGELGVRVHPEHRGKGIGSVMLGCQVGFARALGRTRLLITTSDRYPRAAQLALAMGAVAKQESHINELRRDRVDVAQLERWVAEAATRSSDYELLSFDDAVPEEIVEDYVALVQVMNTAPRDDLEVNDFTLTVAELRENERWAAARSDVLWTLVARHRATGELVGLHNVGWTPMNTRVVYVGSTGVQPEHRGSALGKWLKAEMTLRILRERPQVITIRTGNADSNDAMLGINQAMGYQPSISETTWEISRRDAEAWLERRGVAVPDVAGLVAEQRPVVPVA